MPEALPQIEGVGVHTIIGMALDTPQIADGLAVDSVLRRGLRQPQQFVTRNVVPG